jgi:hypothetical protein
MVVLMNLIAVMTKMALMTVLLNMAYVDDCDVCCVLDGWNVCVVY